LLLLSFSGFNPLAMAAKTIRMEQLKQAIRLHKKGISISEIARRLGISRNTVKKYLRRVPDDPTPQKLPDAELAVHLYKADHKAYKDLREQQLYEHLQQAITELHKPGVNKMLLHEEYLHNNPDGYKYSQYCFHFTNYIKRKDVVMHLDHAAADQLMVDFTGKLFPYVNPATGEVFNCQVLVAVLPHSGFTFCYAVHTQKIPDFTQAITQALLYCKGVPLTILCDNLRTAVTRTCKVEPVFTDACYQLSEHYNTTFSATRVRSPRDKAMVERCVSIIYSEVFARLRKTTFTSIDEVNTAFRQKIDTLNAKPYKGSSFSRRQLFEQNEQHLLKPLPPAPFSLKSVSKATVQSNYHIELRFASREYREYFSVPHIYVGKRVNVLWDNHTVQVYLDQKRIAVHHRINRQPGKYNTLPEHMPAKHQRATELRGLSEEKLTAMARKVGPDTLKLILQVLKSTTYPQQAFKTCNAILLLQKQYDKERLEAACAHAIAHTALNYHAVKTILKSGLDKQPLLFDKPPASTITAHENIRGAANYQ
jgi:transposase